MDASGDTGPGRTAGRPLPAPWTVAGDRVFLPFGNSLEFFAELLAIWKLGACAVPIDARLTAFEIKTLVAAAQPGWRSLTI